MNHEAFIQTFNKRKRKLGQTLCYSTFTAGEVRMALLFSALIGKFEMHCSLMYKRLMHQTGLAEAFQGTINRDLVGNCGRKFRCNLVLRQRSACIQQNT
jgi:hypothetical protein